MWSIAHVTSGYHIGKCRPWPNTGEFRLCCRLGGEPEAGSCHSLWGHCWWEVTIQQPSPHLPLQTDISYSLPWATLCAKNFTSIIPYHPQSYLEVLLLLLGHKRLCKLPKVREYKWQCQDSKPVLFNCGVQALPFGATPLSSCPLGHQDVDGCHLFQNLSHCQVRPSPIHACVCLLTFLG